MRFISIGDAARRLGVDPGKIRRHLYVGEDGQEYAEFDDIRLKVYRRGLLGHRLFDAAEIAYQLIQRTRRRRTDGHL